MIGTSNSKKIPTNNPKDRNLSIGKKVKYPVRQQKAVQP